MNDTRSLVRPTVVWLFLMAATAITVWLGTDHPFMQVGARFAPAMAVGLAFVKAYLIGQDFMEVRNAPVGLRIAFGAWIAAFGAVIVTLQAI